MDDGVKCIKSDFTIEQYIRGTARSLGKLPDGMRVDSVNYTLPNSRSFIEGNVKIENGDMLFHDNKGNKVLPHLRVTVYVAFVPE